MKQNYLKQTTVFFIMLFFTSLNTVKAQDIHFTFANAEITNDGNDDFYEVDVLIESTLDFKLGSGLLYFNYNTAAFGTQVSDNLNVEYSHGNLGDPYILDDDYLGLLSVYGPFIQNDNLSDRFALSFQQAVSDNGMPVDNVTATPTPLLHFKIKFVDSSQDPMICFESAPPFDNQFATACGGSGLGVDCTNNPGVQLFNDTFDCTGAALNPLAVNNAIFDNTEVNLYPNPSSNKVAIYGLKESVKVQIYDIGGKLIIENKNYNGEKINIKSIPTGVYIVKIYSENRVRTKKLVKQ